MSSPYQIAKESGYNDEQIQEYFSKKDPAFSQKYESALASGYQPEEIYQFLSQPKQKESSIGNIGRQAARSGARVAETVLGAPRAIGDALESLVPEETLKKGANKLGIGEFAENVLEAKKKYAPHKLFPKSEDIKKNVTEFLFGEKLKPKNIWEQKADDTISDFAALALPLPGSQLKLIRPALTALGANAASEVVGKMGGSEKQQAYTKIGTFLAGSLYNPKGAEKLKSNLFKQADEVLPQNATVSSTKLEQNINQLEQSLKKGGIAGSDKTALQKIADVRGEMQGAQIPVESLTKLKIKINEARAGLYKELEGNKPGIKSAKRNLDMVAREVDHALKDYGKQNPQWEAFYRPANEVSGAIAQSKKVRNWLKHKKNTLGAPGAITLFGIEQAIGLPGSLKIAATGAGAIPVGELAVKVWKSPTLRKYYGNVIKAALKEDAIAARQNLDKLEKGLKENQ